MYTPIVHDRRPAHKQQFAALRGLTEALLQPDTWTDWPDEAYLQMHEEGDDITVRSDHYDQEIAHRMSL